MFTDGGRLFGFGYTVANLKFEATNSNQECIDLSNNKLPIGALLSFSKDVISFINSDKVSYDNATKKLVADAVSAKFTLTNHEQNVSYLSPMI